MMYLTHMQPAMSSYKDNMLIKFYGYLFDLKCDGCYICRIWSAQTTYVQGSIHAGIKICRGMSIEEKKSLNFDVGTPGTPTQRIRLWT